MWRSLFLALGMYLIFLSGELVMVQEVKASWDKPPEPPALSRDDSQSEWAFKVPRFMPYTTLCVGTVVCIYSFQIPKLLAEKKKG